MQFLSNLSKIIQSQTSADRAGKIRFPGAQKSALSKPSLGECCAPHNCVLLSTLQGTCVCLIVYLVMHEMK